MKPKINFHTNRFGQLNKLPLKIILPAQICLTHDALSLQKPALKFTLYCFKISYKTGLIIPVVAGEFATLQKV